VNVITKPEPELKTEIDPVLSQLPLALGGNVKCVIAKSSALDVLVTALKEISH
jgi:hypothetical protein